jgi:hypothetical protein
MQERGVSKRVSVKFDQVKEDGSFHARETEARAPEAAAPGHAATPAPALEPRTIVEAQAPEIVVPARRPRPVKRDADAVEVLTPTPAAAPVETGDRGRPAARAPSELLEAGGPAAPASKPSQRLREALAQLATKHAEEMGTR